MEKHIAPRLRHVLAMSAPGRPEGANTRTTRNRHLRVLIQFATKWSLTLQVLSYVGGKNCKVFRLPKFWRMPKPGRGGWVKNKVSRCDGRLLLWSTETQKEWMRNFEFRSRWKRGVAVSKGGQTTPEFSSRAKRSHTLFSLVDTETVFSFLCQQSLTNWGSPTK